MRLRRKRWASRVISEYSDIALSVRDLDSLPVFDRLEIGSGRGRFLLETARKHPEARFLGVEVNYNAFSLAVKRAEDYVKPGEETNFWFLNASMEQLSEKIQPGSLETVYLNFSDPWVKKRQYKRRLTYPTRLFEYYTYLKKGGEIRFKTDNRELFEASEQYFKEAGVFDVVFCGVYPQDDEDDVCTEFEEKFRGQGLPIYRIVARKTSDKTLEELGKSRVSFIPEIRLRELGRIPRLTEKTFGSQLTEPVRSEGDVKNLTLKAARPLTADGIDQSLALAEEAGLESEGVLENSKVDEGQEVCRFKGPESAIQALKDRLVSIVADSSRLAERALAAVKTAETIGARVVLAAGKDPAFEGYAAYLGGVRLFYGREAGAWLSLKSASFLIPPENQEEDRKAGVCLRIPAADKDLDKILDRCEEIGNRLECVFVEADGRSDGVPAFLVSLRKALDSEGFSKTKIGLWGECSPEAAGRLAPSGLKGLLWAVRLDGPSEEKLIEAEISD